MERVWGGRGGIEHGTFFAASEGFGVEGFLAFAVGLWDFAGELAFVRQNELLA